jgi:hypothetical protein
MYSRGVAVQEFYEQGDLEKHLGLEPLPFMIRDTHKTAYSNNQKVGSPPRPRGDICAGNGLTPAVSCTVVGPAPLACADKHPSRAGAAALVNWLGDGWSAGVYR